MKSLTLLLCLVFLTGLVKAQSGRRAKEIRLPVPPPPAETPSQPAQSSEPNDPAPATAEKNTFYRCTDDGSLGRILEDDEAPATFSPKELDSKVVILSKPPPGYTKEARRLGVQGFVTLRVLLAGDAKIDRIRVNKGLPAGLTENAIRAACKIKFKPAVKDGQTVGQWLTVEYVFRLADSSIFGP